MATEPNEVILLRRENRHLLRTLLSQIDATSQLQIAISQLHTRVEVIENLLGQAQQSGNQRRRKTPQPQPPSTEPSKE